MLKRACELLIMTDDIMNKVGGADLKGYNDEMVKAGADKMVQVLRKDFDNGVEAIEKAVAQHVKSPAEFLEIMQSAYNDALNLLNNNKVVAK